MAIDLDNRFECMAQWAYSKQETAMISIGKQGFYQAAFLAFQSSEFMCKIASF